MTTDIIVPAEQEGTKAVLKAWLKKRGDAVRIDEPVVEIETDKVAVEIAATADGVLSEILLDEGADVSPGSVLGRIAESKTANEPQRAATPPGKGDDKSKAPAKPMIETPAPTPPRMEFGSADDSNFVRLCAELRSSLRRFGLGNQECERTRRRDG